MRYRCGCSIYCCIEITKITPYGVIFVDSFYLEGGVMDANIKSVSKESKKKDC